jgi:hypothetical protein
MNGSAARGASVGTSIRPSPTTCVVWVFHFAVSTFFCSAFFVPAAFFFANMFFEG